ncbi:MAG TPA: O-antigen ligase family protein [Noviherbaspirillum sp.]
MTSVDHTMPSSKLENAAHKAFCAAFFFLPISKPALFLSLAAAFALFIASGGLSRAVEHWRKLPWTTPALILAALPVLSLGVHPDLARGLSNLDLAYYWALAFVMFLAARRLPILPWLKAFLCGVFVLFCYGQATALGWRGLADEPAAMGNYILYSQMLAISVPLLAVLYAHEPGRRLRLAYLAGIGLFLIGLATGNGRSGLLAVLVLFPFIFGKLFPKASTGKIVLVCVIAIAAVLMSPRVQTRIDAAINDFRLMQEQKTETSLGYRLDMWTTALDMVRDKPLLGAGAYGFRDKWMSTPRTGEGLGFVEPHNAFLFFASSYGLVGLAALIWLYAALLRAGWKQRATLPGGIAFAFAVVVIVGSLTNSMFLGAVSHAWMMLFIGLQGALLPASPRPATGSANAKVAMP